MIFKEENREDIAFIEGLLEDRTDIDVIDVRKLGHGEAVELVINKKDAGVSLDDCEALSRKLDENPDFRERFGAETTLNVASPGLERKLTTLRELEKFRGRPAKIAHVRDGKEVTLVASLAGLESGALAVEAEGGRTVIALENIRAIRLYCEF